MVTLGDAGTVLTGMMVWKDTTGSLVPVVRFLGEVGHGNPPIATYEFIDSASRAIWVYTPGSPSSSGIAPSGSAFEEWIGGACAGTPYVAVLPPARYAFTLATAPGKYYVVPGDVVPTVMAFGSYQYAGAACQSGGITGDAVPVSALAEVQIPSAPPGKPPYHPDML